MAPRGWLHLIPATSKSNARRRLTTSISIASPPSSARWNEEMDERSARRNQETGCHDGLRGLSPSEPGCARIPMVVRSIVAALTFVDLGSSSCTARPGHTSWHQVWVADGLGHGRYRMSSGLKALASSVKDQATSLWLLWLHRDSGETAHSNSLRCGGR